MSGVTEVLLNNAAATGPAVKVGGGSYIFDVVGTFGGATAKLQRLASNDSTWLDVGTDATFTANGQTLVTLGSGKYRVNVSGGSPTGLYSKLSPAS